jgi:parallel beta-helix repeat protein
VLQTPTDQPSPSETPSDTPSPTATPLLPGDYFVATSGDDAAAGSIDAPWRTVQRAADLVPPGSTVFLRDGTYAPFVMRRSGAADQPITFTAYPGETPTIDGGGTTENTVRLARVTYVRLVGLTLTGGFGVGHRGSGIIVENSTHVELRSNTVRDNRAFGIRLLLSGELIVEGNDVYGNAVGIHAGSVGDGTLIVGNRVHDNNLMITNTPDIVGDDVGGDGIAIVNGTGSVLIAGNLVYRNRAASYDFGYDGGAFSVYAASNWTFRDNVTYDNRNVLETGTDAGKTPCANGSFVRNLSFGATSVDRSVGLILRCASNALIANNTFAGLQFFVFDLSHNANPWGASIDGTRIVNNVISIDTGKVYGIQTAIPAGVLLDRNVLHLSGTAVLGSVVGKGTTSSLATFQSWTGEELDSVLGDPLYRDVLANDYRPTALSAAIDLGMDLGDLTNGFTGLAPDAGFAEFVPPAPEPTPTDTPQPTATPETSSTPEPTPEPTPTPTPTPEPTSTNGATPPADLPLASLVRRTAASRRRSRTATRDQR